MVVVVEIQEWNGWWVEGESSMVWWWCRKNEATPLVLPKWEGVGKKGAVR